MVKEGASYWIIEHKHMKEFGGGQNKQINEIIDFVGQREGNREVHCVSFLDGIPFNRLLIQPGDRKVMAQRRRIEENLEHCPSNFFVNTAGFLRLFHEMGISPLPTGHVAESSPTYGADFRLRNRREAGWL
jgi:hypothetical protein